MMQMYCYMLFVMPCLGLPALGDIGVHFPDTDPAYKNIDSKILLQKTIELVKKEGYSVVNIDTTLCLQSPKIKPYVGANAKSNCRYCWNNRKRYFHKSNYNRAIGICRKRRRVSGVCYCVVGES